MQATPGGDWTNNIVDLGAGDLVLEVTRSVSAQGPTRITIEDAEYESAGDLEAFCQITYAAMDSDTNVPVGPALIFSDGRIYAWRKTAADTWRLGLFNSAGSNTTSIGAAAISFAEPDDGTRLNMIVGREIDGANQNIYGYLWAVGDSKPGSPNLTGVENTLTTLKAGMTCLDSSDVPYRFHRFSAGSDGDVAPESDPGVGGTVNTEVLTDEIVVTDEFVAILVGNIARILTDSINVTDGSVFSILRNQLLQDSIIVDDGPTEQYATHSILIDDTLDVVDSVLRYVQHNRTASDAIAITDSLIAAIVNYVILSRTLTSEIAVTDQAFTSLQRFIMLTDLLSVVDSATATHVPDPSAQVFNPIIRIGFDQPRIDVGGYAI